MTNRKKARIFFVVSLGLLYVSLLSALFHFVVFFEQIIRVLT